MNNSATPRRYRAVSMELAAHSDSHLVEMRILTDTGEAIAIVCQRESIVSVQRNVAETGRVSADMAMWNPATTFEAVPDSVYKDHEPAALQRRHRSSPGGHSMLPDPAVVPQPVLRKED